MINPSIDRRAFMWRAAGFGAGALLCPADRLLGCGRMAAPPARKLIVVQFGGGTRCSETIDDPQHRFIPRLWNEMAPHGTLFTNMFVDHKVVHPNSTGSIMTGHWEWDDLDWSKPVANPTIYEIYRKASQAPDTKAWAFVYASILANTGQSLAPGYGESLAANVVEPPTIPRATSDRMDRVMRHAASLGSVEAGIDAARTCAGLARSTSRIARGGLRSKPARDFLDREYAGWKQGAGTTSHDAFLADRARACMQTFAPDVMTVAFGEIDCAHYGSWSRYVDAIRRTDELTWKLWETVQALPAYRDRTLMLVLPDHGRELDSPDGWGFVHHSDFYANTSVDEGCRRVWMFAIGPGVTPALRIGKRVPITSAAATGLQFLGLDASRGAAESVLDSTA